MTPDQIRLVQESFEAAANISGPAAEVFYGRRFAREIGFRPLSSHTDLGGQGARLMLAIGQLAGALRLPERVVPALREMGARVAAPGLCERHYARVGAAMLGQLEQGLGEEFTPAMRDAWAEAYAIVTAAMIEASVTLPLAA